MVPVVKKQRRSRLTEEQQKVAELTAKVASLQQQLAIIPEHTEQEFPPKTESEDHFQSAAKTESAVSALEEQQLRRLEEEQKKVSELTAKVALLQEQLDVACEITEQQFLADPELEEHFQSAAKTESVISALEEQQSKRLEEEQQKVAELTAKVVSLQEQLDTVSQQASDISADPVPVSVTELVPVDANTKVKRIIEALLFAAEQPMTVKQLLAVFPELEVPEKQIVQLAIDALCYDYRLQAIGLHQVASGYRFQVKTDMAPWVARLFAEKPPKYSRALLETIAIIAYQQPVTRGDIEEIRGVSVSSHMIRTLLEREWVKVLAHKEVPGRPALYGTTRQFLDYFNLQSLDAMPPLEELQALALEGELEI